MSSRKAKKLANCREAATRFPSKKDKCSRYGLHLHESKIYPESVAVIGQPIATDSRSRCTASSFSEASDSMKPFSR